MALEYELKWFNLKDTEGGGGSGSSEYSTVTITVEDGSSDVLWAYALQIYDMNGGTDALLESYPTEMADNTHQYEIRDWNISAGETVTLVTPRFFEGYVVSTDDIVSFSGTMKTTEREYEAQTYKVFYAEDDEETLTIKVNISNPNPD